jgi:hypothetical protein
MKFYGIGCKSNHGLYAANVGLGFAWKQDLWCTLNYVYRWTHTNFSTFHAIQILIVIVKN